MNPSDSVTNDLIEIVRDTLALEPSVEIGASSLLFHDLGFTSLDLLDLLFRIEEDMGVSIPEGTLYRLARGDMEEEAFCQQGNLTEAGRERLMALLHDTPREIFPPVVNRHTLPSYCTVGAFVRLIAHERAQAEGE